MPSWSSAISLKGADGLSVLTGQGAPASSIGVSGQAYVDVQNAVLYQRGASGWPNSGVALTGPASTVPGPKGDPGVGSAGSSGSVIYSATGSPPDATGTKGDYFYSSDSFVFYGPKPSATSWSNATQSSLKGPQGQAGVGTAGVDGKTIRSGSSAPSSSTTANAGDFYIQTSAPYSIFGPATAANTFPATGTVLVGASGQAGSQIISGMGTPPSGTGAINDFFFATDTYTLTGPKPSATSWSGATSTVLKGAQGSSGTSGNTVRSGSGAPTASTPAIAGDFYLSTSNPTYTIYGPATGGAGTYPSSGTSLVGPAGSGSASTVGSGGLTFNDGTVQNTAYAGPIALSLNAAVCGPPAWCNGTSLTSTAINMPTVGGTQTQVFVPQTSSAFYGAELINYNNSAAAIYLQLYNLTDAAAVYTSGSLSAPTVTTAGPFAINTYPLTAGKQYVWRVSGNGASYAYVLPQYYLPSSAPFSTQYPPVSGIFNATGLSSTAISCKLGTTGQTQYYKFLTNGYFTTATFYNYSSATAATFILVGGSTTIYTSPSVPAGGTTTVGPFGPAAYPLPAATNLQWNVTGNGQATVSVNWAFVG